jgi:hypothetical protein
MEKLEKLEYPKWEKVQDKINELIDENERLKKAIRHLAAICKYEFGRQSEIEREVNSILKE